MKLSDHLNGWLTRYAAQRQPAHNTYRAYGNAVDKLTGLFGKAQLTDLTPSRVEGTLRKLETHHAPRTVRLVHTVLAAALDDAVEHGHLPRNPARGIRLPKAPKANEFRRLDEEDVKLVLAHAQLVPLWGDAVLLLLVTGLRRFEVCNLRWEDWDFEKGGFEVKTSKTRAGKRWVTVPDSVVSRFEALSRGQRPDSHVFKGPSGGKIHPDIMARRVSALIEGAGVKGHWTTHTLRHTHASILVENGRSLPDVARRLGHSSPRVTMDIYAHPAAKGDAVLAADMEKIL